MFKKLKLSMCLLLLISTPALANLPNWLMHPLLGADFMLRDQTFHNRFGEQHFRQGYPVNNFFVGTRLNRCYGIELGYTKTYPQQKTAFYGGNEGVLGFLNRSLSSPTEGMYISNTSQQGFNANLLGYFPICPKLKTELMTLVGVNFAKMYFETDPIFDSSPANEIARWSSSREALFRVGIGLQQMVTTHFGLRAQALWEDNQRLKTTLPVPRGQGGRVNPRQDIDFYTVKPENSYLFGVGFFYQI